MTITFTKSHVDNKSICKHIDKDFSWNAQNFTLDKEVETGNGCYRLWENLEKGTHLVLDYFGDGFTWKEATRFVEGYLTATCGEQKEGYTCECGRRYELTAWAIAHRENTDIVHNCSCGKKNRI